MTHAVSRLTHFSKTGYPRRMVWRIVTALILLGGVLSMQAGRAVSADLDAPSVGAVPVEDYPIYDEVVSGKFLTSGTTLVIIERMTTTRMLPDSPVLPTVAFFEERAFFDARLPRDLILDFLFKNQRPSRLGNVFKFGVPYRFISGEGEPESEAKLYDRSWWRRWPVRVVQEVQTIDRLAFSRVGFSSRLDQALVYVANDRPDGSGAGFLVWLEARGKNWQIADTEVVWTARSQPD
ncbi:MAG TPA: hypothetical protein VFG71_01075 [Nitrospiraceae bacterium]|nr:hypothetical protein [Nitrospiraceae bacterium]